MQSTTKLLSRPFLWSLLVLALSIIVVQMFYATVVSPIAENALTAGGAAASRGFFVIIKDAEQQVCIIAMLWCSYLILAKAWALTQAQPLFRLDFLAGQAEQGELDLPKALNELEQSQYSEQPLLQTWIICIRRYLHTQDVQNASDAIQASVESLAVRLESGNSMIRYLIWAIPSIGFIGTVRGIGQALAQADEALAGNIAGMVDSLGVAFNSTLVALFISIFLMLLLHWLQHLQDAMVVETQAHCEKYLLKHLHA
ncbi:MotA/TolQ/ExbB proton channel family protein [Bowmanella denitrificans]|uniref:MotA/TolQ/ExbB proton channel family protein n=1 Tax=Bowmanella denitrificans TaxID=366582 RepID=UPI000C9B56ED|nr:MotA/TolQ/ExbB proton channel family protein [Bowmanella denitrificans]